MTKDSPNEFFIVRIHFEPISFIEITSSSGGVEAAQIDKSAAAMANFYVSPAGNDRWNGTLPEANSTKTNGPFATLDHARAVLQSLDKTVLTQVTVQVREGTYFLPSTLRLTAADSGSPTSNIAYESYPGESPVISGGVRVKNWTNVGGKMWQTFLPTSTHPAPDFFVQGGCAYSGGFPYTQYQQWSSNLYWRTDGAFATDSKAFFV